MWMPGLRRQAPHAKSFPPSEYSCFTLTNGATPAGPGQVLLRYPGVGKEAGWPQSTWQWPEAPQAKAGLQRLTAEGGSAHSPLGGAHRHLGPPA